MRRLIPFLLLLLCSTAIACDSYEVCMERATRELLTDFDCSSGHCWAWVEVDDREVCYKKAIKFKLDEITKLLKESK